MDEDTTTVTLICRCGNSEPKQYWSHDGWTVMKHCARQYKSKEPQELDELVQTVKLLATPVVPGKRVFPLDCSLEAIYS